MTFKRIAVLIISVLMLVTACGCDGLFGEPEEITVIALSDLQHTEGLEAGVQVMENILRAMEADGINTADAVLMCGDYDVDSYGDYFEVRKGVQAIKDTFAHLTAEENMVFAQGNHDTPIGTMGLDQSGAHDFDDMGVFIINEDDYMWSNYDGARIQATADNLKAYLDEKHETGYKKPIFIVSHLPLHHSYRTYEAGDGLYASYIFEVLNEAGERGQEIIFLFGHNHGGQDDYLGGAAIYLSKGDEILISQLNPNKQTHCTLNFTYMNAGYVGYYHSNLEGVERSLSMTVFKIKGKTIEVSRYNEEGLCNLKAAGVSGPYKTFPLYEADTTVYTSPQVIGGNTVDRD